MKELIVAIKAAKESGKILMKYYRKNLKVERKSDKTPVTIADRESEKNIVAIIKKAFLGHNFIGEEFKYRKTASDCTWIIDPLDGTKQFIRNTPFFGNCIGLEKNGEIIAGVMYMPAMNLLAYASKGNGAFVNGKRVHVSDVNNISGAFIVFGDVENPQDFGYENRFFDLIRKSQHNRGYGDVLGYILLAQGSVDVAFDHPRPWDVAAAKVIVEEAGGILSDFTGKRTIHSDRTVATNGKLHRQVLEILNKREK